MVQQYKPAYPAEFRQQMVELVAAGRSPRAIANAELAQQITAVHG